MKRINFAKIPTLLDLPNLIEVQTNSFKEFLQENVPAEKRKPVGLQASFIDVFPISSTNGEYILEFVSYQFDKPKFSEEESLLTDSSYTAPLKATFRLLKKQEKGLPKEISQQDVYICDLPLMTKNATFIINGVERVIVTQMHRSPGVVFEEDEENKISSYGKRLYFARIIPYRGAWVEFEFDIHNILYVRIDKKRKFFATTLLRAIGLEKDSDILKTFYKTEMIPLDEKSIERILAEDVFDPSTGEILLEANKKITAETVGKIKKSKIKAVKAVNVIINDLKIDDNIVKDGTITETLALEKNRNKQEAIMDIYKKIRAMEFISPEHAETFLENLIFKNPKKYDLSKVGRYKLNEKLKSVFGELQLKAPKDTKKTLTVEDVTAVIKYVLDLNNGISGREIDDIDHLGNRRIRAVGELLENQIRIGLAHMVRITREKMNMQDQKQITPRTILNTQPVIGIVRKFFGTHQLSQFMDQINPLAELTHKRRLSALGPGGLHRKRAGFEVRDVHHTHYGRVCPIETPEGPNVGLITSLACYAKVNEYGLLETPYRVITNGKVTDKIEYLTADKEEKIVIAQANTVIKDGKLTGTVQARKGGEIVSVNPSEVDYMDISPLQVVSVSAGLIPFLEHDDANRALMGSNMMRQSVPLLLTEQAVVGTGIEDVVAKDSNSVIFSCADGQILSVDARQIAVKNNSTQEIDVYKLKKFQRSNQDTCIDQTPIVKKGDMVKKGQVIADGPATKDGSLALGRNLLIAFMPWEGYNYEDAVLISERLIKEDIFTSIHIQEFIVEARDTKLGPEEITKDIPNVSKDALLNLDENGIITVGSVVGPNDILVGKVTPRGDQQTTPEERLLRVIFGKKAEDVVDASLRVPPGVTGKVSDVKVFTRKEKLSKGEEKKRRDLIEKKYKKELELVKNAMDEKIKILRSSRMKKGVRDEEIQKAKELFKKRQAQLKQDEKFEKDSLKSGNELPIGVNKVVKVYIASIRKLQAGDKVSGRHGNKGVISKILPIADMPYLPDGTPVDVVLSPLSVPSRMNIGQIMELMLSWAGMKMETQMICPVFDSAKETNGGKEKNEKGVPLPINELGVKECVSLAKKQLMAKGVKEKFLPDNSCRITLYDGRTGVPFAEKVTVGYMYMMKLGHLVEDKMHARSTGPYSLITRQPLGGKAQFGGQRLGEMEVWAIEGYGAAHTLQEFLTIKSDDVVGRTKTYECIINDKPITQMGTPESFKVLVKELQSLGISLELSK